ncbi:hypothetical protein Nmel_018856, partial [Mimus melanotis]
MMSGPTVLTWKMSAGLASPVGSQNWHWPGGKGKWENGGNQDVVIRRLCADGRG